MQDLQDLQFEDGPGDLPLSRVRRLHQKLRSPLSMDLQVHRRQQPQTFLPLRGYILLKVGITPVYIVYYMVVVLIAFATQAGAEAGHLKH